MMETAARVALVTGGSRGIGAAIVKRLAREGADVAFTYRVAAEHARAVAAEVEALGRRALPIEADSADPEAVVRAVELTVAELGRVDVLVNNAGVGSYGPIGEVTPQELDDLLAVHVRGVFVAVQAAVRHMGPGARIITIGSSLAERVPSPGFSLYAMTKAAVVGLTRGLARDLGPRGITVNVVNPGSTDTEMNPADGPGAEAERTHIALGRYATPDEIAAAVAYLAGADARYVTGAALAVDGGFAA